MVRSLACTNMYHLKLCFNILFTIHPAYFLLNTSGNALARWMMILSRFFLSQYNHWTKYRNIFLCRSWSPRSLFQDCANQKDQSCALHIPLVNLLLSPEQWCSFNREGGYWEEKAPIWPTKCLPFISLHGLECPQARKVTESKSSTSDSVL